jgi:glycine dehydrogenase subunit 1
MPDFVPRSESEKQEMLRSIGAQTFEDLLADMPDSVRVKGDLDLPPAMSEFEAKRFLKDLASRNAAPGEWTSFLGAGAYDHYIPSLVDHMSRRPEFYTAYTPYQAEVSQGTLQVIYEYQSLIARLTGMEIANASLYDSGTALAEAVLMANAVNRKTEVVISGCANPRRLEVLRTYLRATGFRIKQTDAGRGFTDPAEIEALVGSETACVVMDNPNFLGIIEDCESISTLARQHGALFIVCADPISLGLLRPPSDYGADVVVGEGQALGNRLSFGGPYLGFMAAGRKFIRKLPGRIVGRTVDAAGRTSFCLTLQTREQHIRREKATSNICTNQALVALRGAVYLCWLGKVGLKELAETCLSKAVYAKEALASAGFEIHFDRPFFREYAVDVPGDPAAFLSGLAEHKIAGGIPLGGFHASLDKSILMAFTEKRTREEIDRMVETMAGLARTVGVGG